MNINERFKTMRKELGISQIRLAEELGVSKGLVGLIETGARDINEPLIKLICLKYGVSESWLRTGEGEMFDAPAEPALSAVAQRYGLTDEQRRLVEAYLHLTHAEREIIIGLAREITAGREPADYEPTLRRMLYLLPVSAGSGQPVLEETGEEIDIKKTPAAERAEYVLKISGDSMEPDYHDGQLILVQRTPSVDVGELGIFYADGRVYFKRLGVRELISLNPEVPNIPLAGAEVVTEGRVLGPAETV